MEIATTRCCLDKVPWFSSNLGALDWENGHRFPYTLTVSKLRTRNQRFAYLNIDSGRKQYRSPIVRKKHSVLVGLEDSSSLKPEDPFSEDEHASEDSPPSNGEFKEVPFFVCAMAESVQVMGSFDGWSEGKHLSPEYTGYFNRFSTTLLLRPGRYEIKFLVDGVWHLSPEYPTVGEGLMENNLLIVE